MKPVLIQPEDAIGKTVKDVWRDKTYLLTLFEDQTCTLVAANYDEPSGEHAICYPILETMDEVSIGDVDDLFLIKHGFFTDREIENWYSGN
jgi:hypothetical protein